MGQSPGFKASFKVIVMVLVCHVSLLASQNCFGYQEPTAQLDARSERRARNREPGENLEKTGSNDSRPEFDVLKEGKTGAPNEPGAPQTLNTPLIVDVGLKRREDDDLFEDLMKYQSKEDIMQCFRVIPTIEGMREKSLGKMEVFAPREGLLSVVFQGELANSRGLNMRNCAEYSWACVEDEDVDRKTTPYRPGDLFMDEDPLKLKQAMGSQAGWLPLYVN
ncbi:hypothetical protein B0T26DRAFT_755766 [Lasiosphaeria miniovina]|uniref:Uncharacterized protein n=1 Tax=Lasiosphaeria miniovina TaxID=1954250 RepID=A0AA39ZZ00_9PEZI|nr:uncharacterized protein B0T26DRAFT_755766 [Lasiosphaeria miniovina]KAK0706242.1 hypothetical protein B0T26DRAFT_755766 [Lasiosphaeria miniovina]